MELLINRIYTFFQFFFNTSSTNTTHFVSRLVDFIIAEPLIMAVASFFFVGVVVAFMLRIYHFIL